MINNWLAEFKITQPSDFFKQNPTNDAELVCSILKEKEFLMNTLEFFGLPRGYMEGAGHHPNWGKENSNDKAAKAKLRAKARNQKKTNKGTANKIKALKEARGIGTVVDEDVKPTHFDITVFHKCFKKFTQCNGEIRSQMRKQLLKDIDKTMSVFLDEFNEQSFKKCVDVFELAGRLQKEGYDLDPVLIENMGSILLCFGEIEHELRYGERVPELTEDERRAILSAAKLSKDREEMIKQGKEDAAAEGVPYNEANLDLPKIPVIEPKKPILMLLHLISITDTKFCAQKMFEYDKILS